MIGQNFWLAFTREFFSFHFVFYSYELLTHRQSRLWAVEETKKAKNANYLFTRVWSYMFDCLTVCVGWERVSHVLLIRVALRGRESRETFCFVFVFICARDEKKNFVDVRDTHGTISHALNPLRSALTFGRKNSRLCAIFVSFLFSAFILLFFCSDFYAMECTDGRDFVSLWTWSVLFKWIVAVRVWRDVWKVHSQLAVEWKLLAIYFCVILNEFCQKKIFLLAKKNLKNSF